MNNIAVFASGNGSDLQAIIDATKETDNSKVVMVISDKETAYALKRARDAEINSYCINDSVLDATDVILDLLAIYQVNIIILAGYLKKIDNQIVDEYKDNIYNIHPALLPKFGGAGMYGINVHRAVIESGEKISGATIHMVDSEYDTGEIIIQETIEVSENDTAETLQKRVLELEHAMLRKMVLSL